MLLLLLLILILLMLLISHVSKRKIWNSVCVPWDDAGYYLRFSVTFSAENEASEKRVLDEIANHLGDVQFEF